MLTDLRLIAKQTQDFRTSLHDRKFRIGPLHSNLVDRIQQIKGKSITDIDEDAFSLLHTLDWALSQPELVDPDLLAAYITELIRLMENAGAGLDFRVAMDKALNFYETTGQPVVDLYLAKVEYLRLTDTESKQKEDTLRIANVSAQSAQDRLKVSLKLIQYYIDTSQYELAIEVSETCQTLIAENEELKAYLPKVYDLAGITYYYHFNYSTAHEYLLQAVELGQSLHDTHTTGEALHYLGRIAMDRGDAQQAMEYFISGWQSQPENLADSAWYHLRMGNLLVNAGLIQQARDHYQNAQDLFMRIGYDGSALVQVELGWGDTCRADRDYAVAKRHYQQALRFAKDTRFARGELLSLVKLFWLELTNLYRLDRAIVIFLQAMVNTEVRRNLGLRLVISYLVQVLSLPVRWLTGKPFSVTGVATSFSAPFNTCICPMHSSNTDLSIEHQGKDV